MARPTRKPRTQPVECLDCKVVCTPGGPLCPCCELIKRDEEEE